MLYYFYVQISDLEASLEKLNIVKPVDDVTQLKIDIEKYKKKNEDLENNNSDMSKQFSTLTVELRDKEAAFQAKVNESLHKGVTKTYNYDHR